MTKASNRTRPLDRDGDGRDGGSLPGNQTAPMASAEWTRDDGRLLAKLEAIQVQTDPALTDGTLVIEVANWTDAEAEAAELFADTMAAPGRHQDAAGDERNADGSPIELPPVLGRFLIGENQARPEPETVDDLADARTSPGDSPEKEEAINRETAEAKAAVAASLTGDTALAAIASASIEQALLDADDVADLTDTFTPEEVAAAAQANEAEGEAPAVDAEPTVIPTDDPLLQIETETAPIAVRERELRLLVESRRLYKSPEGYSSNYGAPYVDEATVQAWISAGLAEDVPSAGNHGGVKPTHEARRQLGLIRHGEPA